ncbi:uncharacterized protein CC84DRAFT_1211234 [Paraphaeosphaeria sporulosa]|uniref:RING-type domain-containing protein n=1 Tax=Paraphaeosphaeria sporulosa TaxID=1460663 RepID=A0A177CX06_9PLEO|nr:uncharacterized protein CC84DRAFT_1211234 [Paraphaeosphaeria sporulosa]OAG11578.1 hypothetical protein CC84DRAFT_1211234 [Paraphaeosphaeria sporulosa]
MADHKAARDRCTAFLKQKTEAVDPQDLPVLDECPICLDNYVLEQSVRIKIEGCNHVFGRNCLTAILTNNPRLEKKCPLCRTLWMRAPAGAVQPPVRTAVLSLPGPHARRGVLDPMAIARLADDERARHVPQQRATPNIWTRFSRETLLPERERPREGRVINLIDSDDDEDPLESFNSITHDINNVRERARNTQGSRRQRKEQKKKESAAPNSGKATTVKHENGGGDDATANNGSSNSQRQPGQPEHQEQHSVFPTTFWNPRPRPRPTPQSLADRIQRNWGLPNGNKNGSQSGSQNGNQLAIVIEDGNETAAMDVDNDRVAQSGEQDAPQLPLLGEFSPEESTRVLPVDFGSPDILDSRSSSLRQKQRSRAPPNPFLLSPSPENETVKDPHSGLTTASLGSKAQQERLDQREVELREREERLNTQQRQVNTREQGLDVREGIITAREGALIQREERLREREVMVGSNIDLHMVRQRHLRELEVMLARHREEMGE